MTLRDFFKTAIDRNASDLFLVSQAVPSLRVNTHIEPINHELLTHDYLTEEVQKIMAPDQWKKFIDSREYDFSYEYFGKRFRVNLHFQRGQIAIAARLISNLSPNPASLGFTDVMYNITRLRDGLILVTGPSGSGKSTSLAAMINIINQERDAHIITIEDPIEYVFENDKCLIEQRELGSDTLSFAEALKYSLRQDPNIIMVGEMRDPETMAAALTAAETGHLVLSTLHTASTPDTIFRIVDSFPPYQQQQVLNQLAGSLRAVIGQQLLPKKGGGLIAAFEIMLNNQATANLIRRSQVGQIMSIIQTSSKDGMIPMNKSIDQLVERSLVEPSTAETRKRNLETQASYY
jgi:twitching motility protein PilT